MIVFISAAGGLLVALVVKYADNIIKGFATAIAIVLTSTLSFMLVENEFSLLFAVGAANVILSIFIYSDNTEIPKKKELSPVGSEAELEAQTLIPDANKEK